jgi:hypothetical protein
MASGQETAAAATPRAALSPDDLLGVEPFHAALREAIRRRGLTLERLRFHLARRGISIALSTLSEWQHGHCRPGGPSSLRAVAALEEILRLPGQSLVRLLPGPVGIGHPRGGRVRMLRPLQGFDSQSGVLPALLDGLTAEADRGVETLSAHDTVRVNANRCSWMITTCMVVRARRDGVDRYVLRYFGDPGCDIDRVEIIPKDNCRLGRVRRHGDPPVLVAELLFGEVLRPGDVWIFEHRIVDRTGGQTIEHAQGFAEPYDRYLLAVRFDPRELPVDCHAFVQSDLHDERRRTSDLTLNSHCSVHLFACGVSSGLVGIGWSWPA